MGNSTSKDTGGRVLQKQAEVPPYFGTPISYHFVNLDASIQFNSCFAHIRPGISMNTLDVNSYIPMLNQLYGQGYRMLSFLSLPGTIQTHGFASFNASSTIKYQAVFRSQTDSSDTGRYQIQTEKSLLDTQTFLTGSGLMIGRDMASVSNTNHIYQTISNRTKHGGRFVCLEITGFSPFSMAPGHVMPGLGHHQNNDRLRRMMMFGYNPQITLGVDLFFEMPISPNPEIYNYSIVPLPIQAKCVPQMMNVQWEMSCDWPGLLQQYLGQGWRLVEVFLDQSQQTSHTYGFGASVNLLLNSVWVFEKPLQKMNDLTPVYEGTMIEFPVKLSVKMHALGFAGVSSNVTANWEPTISDMGRQGWELVRILQTPKQHISGMTDSVITMWMFFQRKIVAPSPMAAPPAYDEAVAKSNKAPM